jgi:hypothetical protein
MKKIILDKIHTEYLKLLLIREGKTKTSVTSLGIHRNKFKTKLLQILTLYEQIDSNLTQEPKYFDGYNENFDWGFLKQNKLIGKQSNILDYYLRNDGSYTGRHIDNLKCIRSTIDTEVMFRAISSFRLVKQKIISQFIEHARGKIWRVFAYESYPIPRERLGQDFDKLISGVEIGYTFWDLTSKEDLLEEYSLRQEDGYFAVFLDEIFVDLYLNIKQNLEDGSHLLSALYNKSTNGTSVERNINPQEGVLYVAKTNFLEEVRYLPYPENLFDVLKYRESKEIHRYREVFSGWLDEVNKNDGKAESKIRRDLALANKGLKRLDKVKEYKDSNLNFVVNSIGGHVPVLSNFLTILGTVGYVYQKRTEWKHSWINLID